MHLRIAVRRSATQMSPRWGLGFWDHIYYKNAAPTGLKTKYAPHVFWGIQGIPVVNALPTVLLPFRLLISFRGIKMDIELWECDCNIMFFKFMPDYEMEITRNIETLKRVRNPDQ